MKAILKLAKEGLVVRDPITYKKLTLSGEPKTMNTYWRNRIKEGSVMEVTEIKSLSSKAEKKGAK